MMHLLNALKHASNAVLSMLWSITHMINLYIRMESMLIYSICLFCHWKFLQLGFLLFWDAFTHSRRRTITRVTTSVRMAELPVAIHCFVTSLDACMLFTSSMNLYRDFKYTNPHSSSWVGEHVCMEPIAT